MIIDKMLELGSEIQSYILVDEVRQLEINTFKKKAPSVILLSICLSIQVLHSIFFFGGINYSPRFLPTEILIDEEILKKLKASFPQAFNCFESKLPSRSPMSCVMDMVRLRSGGGGMPLFHYFTIFVLCVLVDRQRD